MKALILAGGKGRRLKDTIGEISKCMISINGRPLLSYVLDNAIRANIEESIIIVGYKAETIINHFGKEYKGMPLKYAVQKEQNGIIDAMETGIQLLNGADFMLLAGDELIFNPKHKELITEHCEKKNFITCGMVDKDDVETIKKTYTIKFNNDKLITELVEKPQEIFNNLKGSCSCIFDGKVFDYKKDKTGVIKNPKTGQMEFGGLLHYWMNKKVDIRYFIVGDKFVNVNYEEDLENAIKTMKEEEEY